MVWPSSCAALHEGTGLGYKWGLSFLRRHHLLLFLLIPPIIPTMDFGDLSISQAEPGTDIDSMIACLDWADSTL
jgi:hypothetical protein